MGTSCDEAGFVVYLRLLDASADDASDGEMAQIVSARLKKSSILTMLESASDIVNDVTMDLHSNTDAAVASGCFADL